MQEFQNLRIFNRHFLHPTTHKPKKQSILLYLLVQVDLTKHTPVCLPPPNKSFAGEQAWAYGNKYIQHNKGKPQKKFFYGLSIETRGGGNKLAIKENIFFKKFNKKFRRPLKNPFFAASLIYINVCKLCRLKIIKNNQFFYIYTSLVKQRTLDISP